MSSGREKGTGPDVRQFDVFLFRLKILDCLSRFVCQCLVVGVVLKLSIAKNDGPWIKTCCRLQIWRHFGYQLLKFPRNLGYFQLSELMLQLFWGDDICWRKMFPKDFTTTIRFPVCSLHFFTPPSLLGGRL